MKQRQHIGFVNWTVTFLNLYIILYWDVWIKAFTTNLKGTTCLPPCECCKNIYFMSTNYTNRTLTSCILLVCSMALILLHCSLLFLFLVELVPACWICRGHLILFVSVFLVKCHQLPLTVCSYHVCQVFVISLSC